VRHFLTAFDANPEVLEWAAGDDDLASIRDRPDYPAK
jgi:hypothetical protein